MPNTNVLKKHPTCYLPDAINHNDCNRLSLHIKNVVRPLALRPCVSTSLPNIQIFLTYAFMLSYSCSSVNCFFNFMYPKVWHGSRQLSAALLPIKPPSRPLQAKIFCTLYRKSPHVLPMTCILSLR